MAIHTRLTERLNIEHPILNAPMGGAAGGRLAAAVTAAGGLGLIGGGSSDAQWLTHEFAEAGLRALVAASSLGRSQPSRRYSTWRWRMRPWR